MQAKYLACRARAVAVTLAVVSVGAPVAAQVVLDGTTGPAGALAGPDYAIGADLGRRAGGNLFHSFARFGLRTGERATFSGPTGIDNVISRVTGGERSAIDGTLRSTIPGADLWFVNPAGVVFGPNARLDLRGSFHVSTADELRFEDGAAFSARDPAASRLTVAAPEAFGFLGTAPADLWVDRSRLRVPPGGALSLVGGEITVTAGNRGAATGGEAGLIRAEAGRITLAALGGPGAAPVAGGEVRADALADIRLTDQALVDASGDGGGTVRIRGGRFVVENRSFIFADNAGAMPASGGIAIEAEAVTIGAGAAVTGDALGPGNAGRLSIRAGELLVTDGGFARSLATVGGRAGDVAVEATGGVEVRDGGFLSSDTRGGGAAGAVTVTAGDLTVRGGGFIRSSAFAEGDAGVVTVRTGELTLQDRGVINGSTFAAGKAGAVTVRAGELTLRHGGQIISGTFGPGAGGAVTVTAERLLVSGDGAERFTGISSQAGPGSTGAAGRVTVRAAELELRGGGLIDSATFGAGNGGTVTVAAGRRLLIVGDDSSFATGIGSDASAISRPDGPPIVATGKAGAVTVRAGELTLRHGGQIISGTFGPGAGGAVTVTAERLLVSGDGAERFTGVSSQANSGSTGAAGAVAVTAGELTLRDRGQISSGTLGAGNAGRVTVEAGRRLLIVGDGSEVFTGISSDAAATRTPGGQVIVATGKAGPVTVTAAELQIHRSGGISSSTFGEGAAGAVTVEAGRLRVVGDDSGFAAGIRSDASAIFTPDGPPIVATGNAGAVTVRAGELTLHHGGAVSSSTFGPGAAGSVVVTAPVVLLADGGAIASFGRGTGRGGDVIIRASDTLRSTGGRVTAQTAQADAGDVTIAAGRLVDLVDGEITTSAAGGAGGGGNIAIDPRFVVLDHSRVVADAFAGRGGDVTIEADNLVRSPDTVISASSRLGLPGTVAIEAPEQDVSGGLVSLPASFVDAAALLPESCAARRSDTLSSFTAAGRGGLPPGPDAPLPGFYALGQAAPAMGAANPSSALAAPLPSLRLAGLELACGGGR